MNLNQWLEELSSALGIEVELDEALILDLARDAAHNVTRPAAPLTTYVLGYAAGRSNADAAEIERLAAIATELALAQSDPGSDQGTGQGSDG